MNGLDVMVGSWTFFGIVIIAGIIFGKFGAIGLAIAVPVLITSAVYWIRRAMGLE